MMAYTLEILRNDVEATTTSYSITLRTSAGLTLGDVLELWKAFAHSRLDVFLQAPPLRHDAMRGTLRFTARI